MAAPQAEELYRQGQAAYDQTAYGTAVVMWQEAYALSNEPEMLFNVAQALRLDGRCEKAIATYRKFIAIAPDSAQRPLADELARELAVKCERSSRERGTRSEADPAKLKIAGLVVAGGGAMSVVAGLYFGHGASSNGAAEARSAETKQHVFVGIGIAAIIGGGIMYWVASRDPGSAPITLAPTRDGGVITWSGSW